MKIFNPNAAFTPLCGAGLLACSSCFVALWVGHANWGFGLGSTIKSSIGWAKGWALLALFILIGACFKINRDVLIRGQNIVGLVTLILLPLLLIAPVIGLPSRVFVSPLEATGGPGPEYFSVYFFTIDPESGAARWQFFAPWSPFAGLIGVTMVLFAVEDKKKFWLICGLLGGLAMIYFSRSRMSLVAIVVCLVIPRLLPLAKHAWAWLAGAALVSSMAIFGSWLLNLVTSSIEGF